MASRGGRGDQFCNANLLLASPSVRKNTADLQAKEAHLEALKSDQSGKVIYHE